MFDEWNIISRRYGFENLFEDIDREFLQTEELLSNILNTTKEIDPSACSSFSDLSTFCCNYRYRITAIINGKSHVREFEDVKPETRSFVNQSHVREPFVDILVDEKNNFLVITAEMPGINKEDMRVNIAKNLVVLHGEKGNKKYHLEIPVKADLEASSARARYTNGILDLKIKLKAPLKSIGTEIKIE